jgi:hypothetical protein
LSKANVAATGRPTSTSTQNQRQTKGRSGFRLQGWNGCRPRRPPRPSSGVPQAPQTALPPRLRSCRTDQLRQLGQGALMASGSHSRADLDTKRLFDQLPGRTIANRLNTSARNTRQH